MINLWPLISNLLVINGSIHSINVVIRTYNWKRAITVGWWGLRGPSDASMTLIFYGRKSLDIPNESVVFMGKPMIKHQSMEYIPHFWTTPKCLKKGIARVKSWFVTVTVSTKPDYLGGVRFETRSWLVPCDILSHIHQHIPKQFGSSNLQHIPNLEVTLGFCGKAWHTHTHMRKHNRFDTRSHVLQSYPSFQRKIIARTPL